MAIFRATFERNSLILGDGKGFESPLSVSLSSIYSPAVTKTAGLQLTSFAPLTSQLLWLSLRVGPRSRVMIRLRLPPRLPRLA